MADYKAFNKSIDKLIQGFNTDIAEADNGIKKASEDLEKAKAEQATALQNNDVEAYTSAGEKASKAEIAKDFFTRMKSNKEKEKEAFTDNVDISEVYKITANLTEETITKLARLLTEAHSIVEAFDAVVKSEQAYLNNNGIDCHLIDGSVPAYSELRQYWFRNVINTNSELCKRLMGVKEFL